MKRSDLSAAQRGALGQLVGGLFAGATLALATPDQPKKYICFRMRGEDMPDIPLLNSELLFVAAQTGLFVSGEEYRGAPGPGNGPSARRWLGHGSLDEVLITLESLGEVAQILDQSQFQLGFRAAMGVPPERGVVEIDLTTAESQGTEEKSLATPRHRD